MGPRILFYTGNLSVASDGHDHSVLVVDVYKRHRFGKDKLIGTLTDTVGEVLYNLGDEGGGTKTIRVARSFTDMICMIKCLKGLLERISPMDQTRRSESCFCSPWSDPKVSMR